jgi:hypothetical protein
MSSPVTGEPRGAAARKPRWLEAPAVVTNQYRSGDRGREADSNGDLGRDPCAEKRPVICG